MANPVSHYYGRQRPSADWIIPGWLKRQNTGFLIGQPKEALKSWLLLNLAWDLADGLPLWGVVHTKLGPLFTPPRPMRVVYFTQEDSDDDIQDRIETMVNNGRRIVTPNLFVTTKNLSLLLSSASGLNSIQAELDSVTSVDLVIFDPMRRMHDLDENDSTAMGHLWRALDAIHHRYKCATLLSHHIIKPPTSKGSTFDLSSPFAARGSGDIYGGGDAFINVSPERLPGQTSRRPGSSRRLTLHFQTKRAHPLDPIVLDVDLSQGKVSFYGFA